VKFRKLDASAKRSTAVSKLKAVTQRQMQARVYVPDLEKMKTWKAPAAEKRSRQATTIGEKHA
jgi:nitrous oxide reductase accessory protein NosL